MSRITDVHTMRAELQFTKYECATELRFCVDACVCDCLLQVGDLTIGGLDLQCILLSHLLPRLAVKALVVRTCHAQDAMNVKTQSLN